MYQIAAGAAENAVSRDTLRGPAQGTRGATVAPPERRASKRPRLESKQAKQEDAEVRRIAPIRNDPEVMLTRFRGHCLVRKQGSFELSGYCFGRVPHSVRKCILFSSLEKKKKIIISTEPDHTKNVTALRFPDEAIRGIARRGTHCRKFFVILTRLYSLYIYSFFGSKKFLF